MKRLIEEKDDEGFVGLIGERIQVWCANYIFAGRLVGVNDHDIMLEDASIVYETGPLTDKKWKDAQKLLPKYWYIRTAAIESYGKEEKE